MNERLTETSTDHYQYIVNSTDNKGNITCYSNGEESKPVMLEVFCKFYNYYVFYSTTI